MVSHIWDKFTERVNAKHTFWASRLISTKGKQLYKAGRNFNCEFISSGSPTYWPTDQMKIPDLVDFFVMKGITRTQVRIESRDDLSLDHTPVILTASDTVTKQKSNPRTQEQTGVNSEKNLNVTSI